MRNRQEPLRRCVATRHSGPRASLVRFVLSPEGEIVPDAAERLPGRGVWVGARRELVEAAREKRLFARALRSPSALAAPCLVDRTEAALARRLLESLGLARKAGRLVAGYEKTRARLRRGAVGAIIAASDGRRDACRRLGSMQPQAPRIECLSAAELGSVLGRSRTVHATLDPGGNTASILRDAKRLEGFRPAHPPPVCEGSELGLS